MMFSPSVTAKSVRPRAKATSVSGAAKSVSPVSWLTILTVIVVIAGWEVITEKVGQYMGAFLILSGLMVGVFAAVDGLLLSPRADAYRGGIRAH